VRSKWEGKLGCQRVRLNALLINEGRGTGESGGGDKEGAWGVQLICRIGKEGLLWTRPKRKLEKKNRGRVGNGDEKVKRKDAYKPLKG